MTSAPFGPTAPHGGLALILAHPDDESFFAAGTIKQAARQGRRVELIVATRGERGSLPPGLVADPPRLAEIRTAEMERIGASLGITAIHWLGLADRNVAASIGTITSVVAELLDRQRPEVIMTFAPDGHNGHPDHVAISAIAMAAIAAAGSVARVLWTTSLEPWHERGAAELEGDDRVDYLVDLGDDAVLKRDALLGHQSQRHVIAPRFFVGATTTTRCRFEVFRHGAGLRPAGPRPWRDPFAG